jgi:phosphoadenosine phosphosulfate reductase
MNEPSNDKMKVLNLEETHNILAPLSAENRILWARDIFKADLVLLSSMQKTASVLMHLFYKVGLENEVLFVDTGYHFTETLKIRDEYMRKYKLNIVTLYPELTTEEQESSHQKKLFSCIDGQPECCRLRKELPLIQYLRDTKICPIIVNGLRRGEGGRRANLRAISPDPRTKGYGLSPIFDWSDKDVAEYIQKYELTVHPLHHQGYPSIGCYPCTTPVMPGEPVRAGRWRHLRSSDEQSGPQYCGINFTDGSGI